MKEFEKLIIDAGGEINRDSQFPHGRINNMLIPIRSKEQYFFDEKLFTPEGLSSLFPSLKKTNECK